MTTVHRFMSQVETTLNLLLYSYLHDGEESVKQIDSLNKGLGAVAKETGQAPQFLHSGVSTFRRHSTVILKMHHYIDR